MMSMNSVFVLTFLYITVVVFFKDIHELAIFALWLIYTLCKTRFRLGNAILTFGGLSGLILNLRQSRERHLDQIEALNTAMTIHFIILSKPFILTYSEQMHSTLKTLYKKHSLCVKVFFISSLTAAIIMFCMYLVCIGIDVGLMWIKNGSFFPRNNFVTFYGKFRIIEQNVDISDDDLTFAQKIFTVGGHQSSLISKQYLTHKDVDSLPHTKYLIHAYPGEEIELTCSIRISLPGGIRVNALSFFFVQDSVEVKNSLRRRIRIPDEMIQNGSHYTWSLTLLELRSDEFGVYRAGLRSLQRLGTTCSTASETMYQSIIVRDEYACEFNLSHIVDYYTYVNAPVGALLSYARLHIHSKSDYLRVEHYVNGKPLSMIPNITSKCCLPSVHFFSEVIWTGMPLYLPWTKMIYDSNLQQSEVLGEVCMCSSLYGIHRFKFYNDIYDIKRKTWVTSEFWYPQITVVYPTPSIMPWKYRSERESKLFDSSKNERNFSIFEGPAFELLQSNLDDDFVVMEVIDRCLILFVFCIIITLACLSLFYLLRLVSTFKGYAYERLGLIIRVKLPDTGGNLANALSVTGECQCYHYDVFILNVDDDRTFVLYELYPVLLERQFSVFLSEEHPRPGPKLDTLKQALTASKKVIVVISDGFINDKYYNNFFLPHIVLRRLDKGMIGSRHLMLLVSETCLVPESLIADNRIVTLDSTRNPKDIVLRKLKEWLDSPVIPDGFGERPVLHSDLLQLYQA